MQNMKQNTPYALVYIEITCIETCVWTVSNQLTKSY